MGVELVRSALERRRDLLARLRAESTDCYRLFHGVAEGRPGLTLDRYGPILLLQTWREPLTPDEIDAYHHVVEEGLNASLTPVWNHRTAHSETARWDAEIPIGVELGVRYDVRPRHRGQDPLLFLDLRAGRHFILEHVRGKSVLNLFAYTGGVSVCAAIAGATEIWNVDFARSAIDWARRNLELNDVDVESVRFVQEDVIPVIRQLAGLPVKGRAARNRDYQRFEPQSFDVVVLDPPRWAKSPFGAVDLVRDYPSLLKPALLATAPGGTVLATNNAACVDRDTWVRVLERTAEKCGRPFSSIEVIEPDPDFPSVDDAPPLKIACIRLV